MIKLGYGDALLTVSNGNPEVVKITFDRMNGVDPEGVHSFTLNRSEAVAMIAILAEIIRGATEVLTLRVETLAVQGDIEQPENA